MRHQYVPLGLGPVRVQATLVRGLAEFGCRGDGATGARAMAREGQAWQRALDWVGRDPSHGLRAPRGAVYAVDQPLRVRRWLDLDMRGAQITWHADGGGLHYEVRPEPVVALAQAYHPGALDLYLAEPLPAAPPDGSVLKIVSDAADPANRDKGAARRAYRIAEWAELAAGSTAQHLRLRAPLKHTRGIDPTSAPGEEPEVPAYTPAMDARVTLLPRQTARILGGLWGYRDGMAAQWTRARVIGLSGGMAPDLRGLRFTRSYDAQIRLAGTYRARLSDIHFARGENNTANRQLGYGLSDGGYATELIRSTGEDCRHIYTTNSVQIARGSRSYHRLLTAGRVTGGRVRDCQGRAGRNGLWDTHHDAEGTSFHGIDARDAQTFGATLRGRDLRVDGLMTQNTRGGARVFTEFQSGDPEDDFFTAGKTPADFTSARLRDLTLSCRDEALSVRHATARFEGPAQVVTRTGPWVEAKGGRVVLAGQHDVRQEGGTACILAEAPHPAALPVWGPQTRITVEAGARIEVDARAADATLRGIRLDPQSFLDIHGDLTLRLPRGAQAGDLDRVRCLGGGRLRLSIEGAPDAVLTKSAAEAEGLVVDTLDGSAWWHDPADAPGRWLRPTWRGAWAGQGTWVPPGLLALPAMERAGQGQVRLELSGQSHGGTLRLGSNGLTCDLPAGPFEVEVTCYLRAANRRYLLVTRHAGGANRLILSHPAGVGPVFALDASMGLHATVQSWATRGGHLPFAI